MGTAYGLPNKREEVITALQEAYTSNNLSELEYERRLERAYGSNTMEELAHALDDFPFHIKNKIFNLSTPQSPAYSQLERKGAVARPTKVTDTHQVILSDQKKTIQQILSTGLKFLNILGSQKINCTEALHEGEMLYIDVSCYLGSIEIDLRNHLFEHKFVEVMLEGALCDVKLKIPQGVAIERDLFEVGSSTSERNKRKWNPFTSSDKVEAITVPFTLRISGSMYLSSLSIIRG